MPKKITRSKKKTAKKTTAKKAPVRKASSKKKAVKKIVKKPVKKIVKKPVAAKPAKKKIASKITKATKATKTTKTSVHQTSKVVTKTTKTTKTKKRKSTLSSAAAAAAAVAAVQSAVNTPEPDQIEVVWTDAKRRRVKTGLTKKDIGTFKTSLLKKRKEIIGDVQSLESSNTTSGNLSHMPLHMADVGSDNYDQEFTLGLVESERKLLFEINNALGRVIDGTYGVCLVSGKPIPPARLEIKPWAKYTIEVVREHERLGIAS